MDSFEITQASQANPYFYPPASFPHPFTLQTLSVDLRFNTLKSTNTKVRTRGSPRIRSLAHTQTEGAEP